MNRTLTRPWTRRLGAAAIAVAMAASACSSSGPSGTQTPASASPPTTATGNPASPVSSASSATPFRIGAVLEITGEGASLGVPMRDAMQLAVDHLPGGAINGRKVELVVLDNQSKPDVSAQVVTRLITEEKVDLIVGPSRSGNAMAVRQLAEDNKIPMISLGASNKITDGATWVFKTPVNTTAVLENMVSLAVKNNWKNLSVLRDSTGFGDGVAEALTALATPSGIAIATVEKFDPTATDFTAQIIKLRQAKADANIIWGIPPAVALAQKAYVDLGMTAPVMQSHGIGNSVFLETAGAAANGLLAPLGRLLVYSQLSSDNPQRDVIDSFVNEYKTAFGSAPSSFAGNARDAIAIGAAAFSAVGSDKKAVRDYIEGLTSFSAVTGIYSFSAANHSGLDKHAMAIVTVKDGAWTLVDDNR